MLKGILMIKAAAKIDSGHLIVLGLTDKNIERMKQDDPVLFCLSDLGLGTKWVCLSYTHPDNRAAFPQGFEGFGLAFNEQVLESMASRPVDLKAGDFSFCVFRGKDEQSIEQMMRGLIGPETKVTHDGFSPSDIPPILN